MADQKTALSPIEIQKYLGGVDYPTGKDALRSAAEKNGAPQDVLDLIDHLPGDNFGKPTDVMKAFGELR